MSMSTAAGWSTSSIAIPASTAWNFGSTNENPRSAAAVDQQRGNRAIGAGDSVRVGEGPAAAAERHVLRRGDRRRGEFQGQRLCALARQYHRARIRRRGDAAARVWSRWEIPARDRQEPLPPAV